MRGKYANIIVDISHEKVDRPFQYRIPPHLQGKLEEGMAVTIPFGKGNKELAGYVMEVTDQAEYAEDKLKDILDIRVGDMPVEADFIRLAAWMKRNYGSTMITALKTVLPVRQKKKTQEKRTVTLKLPVEEAKEQLAFYEKKHQTARARLLKDEVQTDFPFRGFDHPEQGLLIFHLTAAHTLPLGDLFYFRHFTGRLSADFIRR